MQQSIVHGYPPLGIDHQHTTEQVASLARLESIVLITIRWEQHVREQLVETEARIARPVLHIVAHRWLQPQHELLRWRSQLLNDLVPLVDVVGAREEHAAADHLAHDATDRPNIHVLRVAHAQDHFGSSVVASHDIRGHHEGGASGPRQAKVEDF